MAKKKIDDLQTDLEKETYKKKMPVFLTSVGLKKIHEELNFLKLVKTREVAERINNARELGGQNENSELDRAVEEQTLVESRILLLEEMLKNVSLIKASTHQQTVVLGSTVLLEIEGEKKEFMIVGKFEANPLQKRVSNESPIGAALLGAQIGQSIEVKTPVSTYLCKILEIQ